MQARTLYAFSFDAQDVLASALAHGCVGLAEVPYPSTPATYFAFRGQRLNS